MKSVNVPESAGDASLFGTWKVKAPRIEATGSSPLLTHLRNTLVALAKLLSYFLSAGHIWMKRWTISTPFRDITALRPCSEGGRGKQLDSIISCGKPRFVKVKAGGKQGDESRIFARAGRSTLILYKERWRMLGRPSKQILYDWMRILGVRADRKSGEGMKVQPMLEQKRVH